MNINLKNESGKIKNIPIGFSWTTFFFGPFVPILRGDFLYFVIMLIALFCTYGVSGLIFPFFYNKLYIKRLLKKGFKPADDVSGGILHQKGIILKSVSDTNLSNNQVQQINNFKSITLKVVYIITGLFIFVLVIGLFVGKNSSLNSAEANIQNDLDNEGINADMSQMYDEKIENEYAFNQKYANKELTFKAVVDDIRPDCYKNPIVSTSTGTPCIEVSHPIDKVYRLGVPSSIADILMVDNNVLNTLKKGQKIKLTCLLSQNTSFYISSLSSLIFEKCRLYEKKKIDINDSISTQKTENTPNLAQNLAVSDNNFNSSTTMNPQTTDFREVDWRNASYQDIINMINAGADINQIYEEGTTVLMLAIDMGANPQAIQALIDKGANVNVKNDNEYTVLHMAAYQNNPQVIEILVKNGADINSIDFSGMTPLMLASKDNKNQNIIETLIKLGANVNARSMGDMSAIDYAAYSNKNPAVIEMLIKLGAELDENTLSWAEENENPNIKIMLKKHLKP